MNTPDNSLMILTVSFAAPTSHLGSMIVVCRSSVASGDGRASVADSRPNPPSDTAQPAPLTGRSAGITRLTNSLSRTPEKSSIIPVRLGQLGGWIDFHTHIL